MFVFCFQHELSKIVHQRLRNKEQMHDGGFVAAMLESAHAGSTESGGGHQSIKALIERSSNLLRGVKFSSLSRELMRSKDPDPLAYALSVPCKSGDIDFFLSHSWSDDGDCKYERLEMVATNFMETNGREPMFWLDKCCIDQNNIKRDLACLPVFQMACSKMLVLCGETYVSRMWCILELYTFFVLSPTASPANQGSHLCYACQPLLTHVFVDLAMH